MTAKVGDKQAQPPVLAPTAVLPTDKSAAAAKAPSPKAALTEKVDTLKWQIPKDLQTPNPKSCVWTVLTVITKGTYNPLHWIACIVSTIWDCIMCKEENPNDPVYMRKVLIQTHENKIEGLQSKISQIQSKANALQTTISSSQVTTAESLYKWIQVLNELAELRAQGDAVFFDIDALGASTKEEWDKLKEEQAPKKQPPEAPPQQVDPSVQEHLLQFQEQNVQCGQLLERLNKFFGKHQDLKTLKTAKDQQAAQSALSLLGGIQTKTLATLREKAKQGPIRERKDVKDYFEYSHLFDAIKKHKLLSKEQIEGFSKTHTEILGAAGSLTKEWDSERPLKNYGNTCWLNSTIQAIYHCPPLRAMMRQELVRENRMSIYGQPIESDATWSGRSLVYGKLQNLFVTMDLGEDDKVAQALQDLVDCIHETNNDYVVSLELSKRNGGQNPVLTSVTDFLRIIGFKIDFTVYGKKVFNDKQRPSVTEVRHRDEDFETCWIIDMPSKLLKKNAPFVDFLEAAATERDIQLSEDPKRSEGILQQKKTFTTLPPVFVTAMKRMHSEPISPEVHQDAETMMAAFAGRDDIWGEDPQENWNTAVNAALALHKGNGGGGSGKIETPINLQAGQQLDLSKSFLTTGLAERARAKYRLVSVADQSGGLEGGHFVAYTRQGDKWSTMSDESVTRNIEDKDMDERVSTALIYFWVREDLLPPAARTAARAAPAAAAEAPREKKHKGTHKDGTKTHKSKKSSKS